MTKNLKVDDELHKELKQRALDEGIRLRELVYLILKDALKTRKEGVKR